MTKNVKANEIYIRKLDQFLPIAYVSSQKCHFIEEHGDKKFGEEYYDQNKKIGTKSWDTHLHYQT